MSIIKRHLKKLEEVRQRFKKDTGPTPKQSDSLGRNLQLLREKSSDWEALSSSALHRHKTGQSILKSIIQEPGRDSFYFAALALSSTALQSVDSFVADYRVWWNNAEIPKNFLIYSTDLEKRHNVVDLVTDASQTSSISRPKRQWDEDASEPTSSKRRRTSIDNPDLAVSHPENRSSAGRTTEEMPSDNDSEEPGEAEAEPLPPDAPMGGSVYVLKRFDAIAALVNEPHPRVKLTMPNDEWRPFITFQCSEVMAKEFLKKRTRVL